ncbi:type II toxin-antitoxin system Phd/YefM family antitoxin [Paenisporosarcina sp. TG-14]|uniref:type II toxin-antitoxin system Phd/YefM family antitoxin n=1 Tax=Paenisporosarcina sp. TG-14 TaxID=1231057 RepID=UPI0002F1E107|nr:type II toxin-antitoxin system prevent-host-death family antitoxin [Paenisporosarcina sp. TG-14]
MPSIRPSSDLRNRYSEIAEYCHQHEEPVFITKNGKGDLVIMSMETYEKIVNQKKDTILTAAESKVTYQTNETT